MTQAKSNRSEPIAGLTPACFIAEYFLVCLAQECIPESKGSWSDSLVILKDMYLLRGDAEADHVALFNIRLSAGPSD